MCTIVPMSTRAAFIVLAIAVFTTYSLFVVAEDGYFGFLTMAAREPWGLQVLLDLAISLSLFNLWMYRDARERNIAAWPYIVAMPLVGSIGALAYLLHRELRAGAGVDTA